MRNLLLSKPTLLAAASSLSSIVVAQSIPIPLNYNFNGIVHVGEAGLPDAANGYRSISDRGLDFSGGVPSDSLLTPYRLVSTPGSLDIVHLGNRNSVDNGSKVFDVVPDGDDIGIQPNWLPIVDQTGPQVTTLPVPIPVDATTEARFVYQISNGGGAFDVTFRFVSGRSVVRRLSGGDWFGGTYAGTQNADSGLPGANLTIAEGTANLGSSAGEAITSIEFSNRSNPNAGYAILAGNINRVASPRRNNQIPLNYNFNGIVHAGEAGLPDDPNGYRSISDRGLDFAAGIPNDPLLASYQIVPVPRFLDIVHLGNRNTVDNGNWAFDPTPDGDNIGIQPTWLPNPDQTGPQITTLTQPILLDSASAASVLFQISNGGGSFDVAFGFRSGRAFAATIAGGDWFGGTFAGTQNVDSATVGNSLSLSERRIDLSAQAGEVLTVIAFLNRSNPVAGYAILAANVSGCLACANAGGSSSLGGGNGATLTATNIASIGCDLGLMVSGGRPSNSGFLLIDLIPVAIPLSLVFPACTGTLQMVGFVAAPVATDPFGLASIALPIPGDPNYCGAVVLFQYAQLQAGQACPLRISNGLAVTVGN